jgi:hypothetical protein
VVVTDILIYQAFQMAFIHNNYVVEQIAPTVGNGISTVNRSCKTR